MIAASVLAVAACVAIVATRFVHSSAPTQAAMTSAPEARTTAPPPQPSVAVQTHRAGKRVLVVEPRDAVVTFDGARVAPKTQWLEGTTSALLHVEAPGWVAKRRDHHVRHRRSDRRASRSCSRDRCARDRARRARAERDRFGERRTFRKRRAGRLRAAAADRQPHGRRLLMAEDSARYRRLVELGRGGMAVVHLAAMRSRTMR